MKKLVLVAALAAIVALPLNAMAAYYTLNVSQIHNIVPYYDDGSGFTSVTSISDLAYGSKFVGNIQENQTDYGYQCFYTSLGGLDLSAYDGFGLCLENVNENPWDLYVFATDAGFDEVWSVQYDAPTFAPTYLTVDWDQNGAFGESSVWEVGFCVSGSVPKGGAADDWTYEVRVAPLPEPGTLALFGFGLAGAAASYRRKRAAKKA